MDDSLKTVWFFEKVKSFVFREWICCYWPNLSRTQPLTKPNILWIVTGEDTRWPYLSLGHGDYLDYYSLTNIRPFCIKKPSYYWGTLAESCCRGKNQSTAFFDCWPKGHFWLLFTVLLTSTILNNTRQCFYQSKTVDSFWPVNVLTTRKVWECLTFKCTR